MTRDSDIHSTLANRSQGRQLGLRRLRIREDRESESPENRRWGSISQRESFQQNEDRRSYRAAETSLERPHSGALTCASGLVAKVASQLGHGAVHAAERLQNTPKDVEHEPDHEDVDEYKQKNDRKMAESFQGFSPFKLTVGTARLYSL